MHKFKWYILWWKRRFRKYKALYLLFILKNNYDSYFNEKGYKIINEINPLTNSDAVGIYLPKLLIPNPAMGKSTFIIVVAWERISKSTSPVEPDTNKAIFYNIKIVGSEVENNDMEINNDLLKQEAYIRFIDIQGFDQSIDVATSINTVENIFNNFEEGKERIPIILYFLSSERSFGNEKNKKEKTLKLLIFLQKIKAKILFILSGWADDDVWDFLKKIN